MQKILPVIKASFVCLFLICLVGVANSQIVKQFNILPDFGGIDGAGTAWHVYPDSDFIYVIGNTDTSFYGSITRPVLARFDYEGHLLSLNTVIDSLSNFHMVLDLFPIIKEPNGFTLFMDRWSNVGSPYYDLIKLNKNNGNIVYKKKLPPPHITNFYPSKGLYYKTPDGRYIISGYIGDKADLYFAKLDSSFTIISEFVVPAMNRWSFAGYMKEQLDSSLIIVGYSTLFPDSRYNQPYLLHISPSGEMLDFILAPDSLRTTFSGLYNTILKDEHGNWIFSSDMDSTSFGCHTCKRDIPFLCAISTDFDSLLWVRYLDYPVLDSELHSSVYFLSEAPDHSGYISVLNKFFDSSNVIYLSKVSPEGDSLWTRSIKPLEWEDEEGLTMSIWQFAVTPYNTFVGVGTAEDQTGINRPWLFQLDSVGCLVQGCDQTVAVHDVLKGSSKDFKIYPNPVSEQLYILYQGTNSSNTDFRINLKKIDGTTLRTLSVHPIQNEQYILSLAQIPAGEYIVSFENELNSYLQSEVIVKQE